MEYNQKHLAEPLMLKENHTLHKAIISVYGLLSQNYLTIPTYQRPYKWTAENINDLFSDIATHSDKGSYRLGTIVFHHDPKEEPQLNIVDGQQRTITLLLTAHALINKRKQQPKRQDLKADLEALQPNLDATLKRLKFPNEISRRNINNNYLEISRIINRPEFTEDHIHYFLKQCEVVSFVLDDISEAFQFFDSQNARGRDLSPHDLLKAYHLREFADEDAHLKAKTVAHWEDADSEALATLFANKLFRIRNWMKGASARYFTKDDTKLFKGVNLSTTAPYPYTDQLRISHHFVDHHRTHYERQIDRQHLPYPFQLDQIILNGRRFFEMVDHYMDKMAALTVSDSAIIAQNPLNETANEIMTLIDKYTNRHRTGDRYVRTVFDCLLIYYIDKFGSAELSLAIEKIFIWSYTIRLLNHAVQLATADKYVLERNNLFVRLKEAINPKDFTQISLPILTEADLRPTAPTEIEQLFRKMGYLPS